MELGGSTLLSYEKHLGSMMVHCCVVLSSRISRSAVFGGVSGAVVKCYTGTILKAHGRLGAFVQCETCILFTYGGCSAGGTQQK